MACIIVRSTFLHKAQIAAVHAAICAKWTCNQFPCVTVNAKQTRDVFVWKRTK